MTTKTIHNQEPIVICGQVRFMRSLFMKIFMFNNELSDKIKRKKTKHDELDLIKAKQEQNKSNQVM